MQEITVIKGLQAEVVKLQIALSLQGRGQARQVKLPHARVQQFVVDAFFDQGGEAFLIVMPHLRLGDLGAKNLFGDGVHQQAGRGIGVVGVFFNQGARGQDGGFIDLFDGDAVIQVAHCLGHDRLGLDVLTQTLASRSNDLLHPLQVQGHALTVVGHMQRWCAWSGFLLLRSALAGAALAVEHISACNFVVAAAHQAQLDLVLNVFDVKGAAARSRAHQCAHHRLGQAVDGFAHAGRCGTLGAMHRQKGFHQRHGDLRGLKGNHSAIAANDLVVAQRQACGGLGGLRGRGRAALALDGERCLCELHGEDFPCVY